MGLRRSQREGGIFASGERHSRLWLPGPFSIRKPCVKMRAVL